MGAGGHAIRLHAFDDDALGSASRPMAGESAGAPTSAAPARWVVEVRAARP